MLVTEIVGLLRLDIGDTAGELLSDEYLTRCVAKAVYAVIKDFRRQWSVAENEIVPDPTGTDREIIILKAHINVCILMRSITASNFSFESGDKSVDKTKQPGFWADLQEDLEKQYDDAVAAADASDGVVDSTDSSILVTPGVMPTIYEESVFADEQYPYRGYEKERG